MALGRMKDKKRSSSRNNIYCTPTNCQVVPGNNSLKQVQLFVSILQRRQPRFIKIQTQLRIKKSLLSAIGMRIKQERAQMHGHVSTLPSSATHRIVLRAGDMYPAHQHGHKWISILGIQAPLPIHLRSARLHGPQDSSLAAHFLRGGFRQASFW